MNPYPNHITALPERESDRVSGMDCTLRVRTTCIYKIMIHKISGKLVIL